MTNQFTTTLVYLECRKCGSQLKIGRRQLRAIAIKDVRCPLCARPNMARLVQLALPIVMGPRFEVVR